MGEGAERMHGFSIMPRIVIKFFVLEVVNVFLSLKPLGVLGSLKKIVPGAGIEPAHPFSGRGILSPLCLPIPPSRHRGVKKHKDGGDGRIRTAE